VEQTDVTKITESAGAGLTEIEGNIYPAPQTCNP